MLRLIQGVGVVLALTLLILGTTDTVSAQASGYGYDSVSRPANIDAVGYLAAPITSGGLQWVADERLAADGQKENVQGLVPLYSQLDNLGMKWTSCGPTSLAMALNYLEIGPTPQEIIAYAINHRGQDDGLLYEPWDPDGIFTSPQHLYEIATHYGRPQAGWVTREKEAQERLRNLLSQDLPVIADVTVSLSRHGSTAAHFVVVTGIASDNTIQLHDPYGEGQGGRVRTVSWNDFYWAWQNNSDGNVGGHGWWLVIQNA